MLLKLIRLFFFPRLWQSPLEQLSRGLYGDLRPLPFTMMDISWENAFGGPGNPLNLRGKGLVNVTDPSGRVLHAPSQHRRPGQSGLCPRKALPLRRVTAADGGTVAKKVFFEGAKAMMVKSKVSQTMANEPGALGGVVSGKNMAPAAFKKGSGVLFIEGAAAVFMGCPTVQNGNPFNAMGAVIVPSQQTVMIRR